VPQAVATWIATYTLTATSVLTYSQILALTYTAFAAATITYSNHQRRKQQRAARNAFNASVEDRLVMTATAQAARSRVYGRVRNVDGVVFKHTHGANKQFYTLVIALAGHEVDAIEQVWFNDVPVALDGDGYVTTAPWNTTQPFGSTLSMTVAGGAGSVTLPPGFQSSVPPVALLEGADGFSYQVGGTVAGNVFSVTGAAFDGVYRVMFQEAYTESRARVRRYTGAPGQNLYNDLTALVGAAVGPSDRFEGFAALLVTLQYDQDAFPTGVPNISAVMRGARVFDPRTSTTAWTENPALIARDWSLHPHGGGCVAAEINEPAFTAAANACDVSTTFALPQGGPAVRPLYQCGIVIPLDANPDEALGELCEAMAGQWGWAGGRLSVRAGVYRAPVATVTEDWVTSVEAIQITPGASTAEAVNVLRPTYADQGQGYVQTPGPEVRAAAYVTADGRELVQELQLGGVTQSVHAQHVCGVLLREAREALTVQLPCNLRAYPLELFDVVSVTLPRFGWAAKLFEVVAWRFSPAGGVLLTLRETAAANYTVAAEFDVLTASPNTGLARPEAPPAITGLAATSGGVAQIDGSSLARIRVTWAPVASEAVRQSGSIELQVAEVYAGLPAGDWPAVPPAAGRAVAADIFGQRIGRLVAIRARAVNTLGMRGPWVQITHQVSGRRAPVVWRQATAPADASVQDNDEWVDTDDANRRYLRAGGAWVDVRDATIATAATTATWTSVSSRPANLAGLGGAELIRNDQVRAGGTNLVGNSGFLRHAGGVPVNWLVYNDASIVVTKSVQAGGMFGQNYYRITANASTTATLGIYTTATTDSVRTWEPGQTYCITFWARGSGGALGREMDSSASSMGWTSFEYLEGSLLTSTWQRFVARCSPASNAFTPEGGLFITYRPGGSPLPAGSVIDICCPKVELGTQPSSWTPSPQDTLNELLVPSINSAATTANWASVAARPSNIAALSGGEAIRNDQIGVSGGVLTGIGTAGVQVDNSYAPIGQNRVPNSEQSLRPVFGRAYTPNGGTFDPNVTGLSRTVGPAQGWTSTNYLMPGTGTDVWVLRQNGASTGSADPDTIAGKLMACDVPVLEASIGAEARVQVIPGQRYCFSVYSSEHRCNIRLYIAFVDLSGITIAYVPTGDIVGAPALTHSLAVMNRHHLFAVAPANAVAAWCFVRKSTHTGGDWDSYLFLAAPVFEAAAPNQTGPSPYQPGPVVSTRELGYTGDLNATLGAPAGTPVGSILAEQVESQTGAAAKATAARVAAEAAAAADAAARANLAEVTAKAYADGIVDAEEARAIADATAKANAAQAAAIAAAAADATAKANAARAAAEATSAAALVNQPPFTVSASPASISYGTLGNGVTQTVTVTPSGGTAPYTYSWTLTAYYEVGGSYVRLNSYSANTASVTVWVGGDTSTGAAGELLCVAIDKNGRAARATVQLEAVGTI
jgi:hypothetical protein